MNNNFAACVQSVRHQHADMISIGHATGQKFKVKPSLYQELLQAIDVINLFFTRIAA